VPLHRRGVEIYVLVLELDQFLAVFREQLFSHRLVVDITRGEDELEGRVRCDFFPLITLRASQDLVFRFHDNRPEELHGEILESNPNSIQVKCYTRHSPLHEDLNSVFVHNSEAYHLFLAENTTDITLNSSYELQLVMKNDRARHLMSHLWERPWHYPEEELEVGIPVHKVWHFKSRFELVEDRLSAMDQVMQLFHD
jgi:hypothetical protein